MKLDPSNVELLTQKQKLLAGSIEQTKKKLDALKDAEKRAQKAFKEGKISEQQYNALKREIIETEQKLGKLESQAVETNNALKNGAQKAETGVEGIGTAATNVKSKLSKLKSAATSVFNEIESKADKAAKATQGISTAAGALGAAVIATVPASQELTSDLSKLKINAKENEVAFEAAEDAMKSFYSQSGEIDSSIEAVSNLLQAGATEHNIQRAMENLSGAAIRFPDTLKVESLADSLQETIATGEATGQFAELLERLGINLDTFNAKMAVSEDETFRLNAALNYLEGAGLKRTYDQWIKENEVLAENREANYELQQSIADFATTITPLLTMVTQGLTELMTWFNSLDEGTQMAILGIIGLVAIISPALGTVSSLMGMISSIGTLLGGISGVALGVGAAIIAAVAVLAMWGDEIQAGLEKVDGFIQKIADFDFTTILGPTLGPLVNLLVDFIKQIWDLFKGTLDGLIDFIRGVFTGNWDRAWQGISKICESMFNNLLTMAKKPINGIIELINGALSGLNNLISGFNTLTGLDVPTFGKIPMFANGGILSSGSAIVGEAGAELLTVTNGVATVTPLNIHVTNNNNFGNYNHAQGAAVSRDLARQIDRELGRVY